MIAPLTKRDLKQLLARCLTRIGKEGTRIDEGSRVIRELRKRGISGPTQVRKAMTPLLQDVSVLKSLRGFSEVVRPRGPDANRRGIESYERIYTDMEGERWFVFMNHGYAPSSKETRRFPSLSSEDGKWRHQVFLYLSLMNAARPLWQGSDEVDLLDVGCGRGGGISAMKRYGGLRRAVGLDRNDRQIAFCKDRHRDVGVEFEQGSAMDLPFEDRSFDWVSNVESSHCYTDMRRFLREVRRILKPDGLFLFTDIRDPFAGLLLLEKDFEASGMRVALRRDITSRVREACALDVERFDGRLWNSKKAALPRDIAKSALALYSRKINVYMTYVLRTER